MRDCKEIFEIIMLFHLDIEKKYSKVYNNLLEDVKDHIEIFSGYQDQLSQRGNLFAYISNRNII